MEAEVSHVHPSDDYAVVAEYYDAVPVYAGRTDVPFFVEMAKESGGPVLELGCGTGRVVIPTARAGIETTGLDGSAAMLEKCREFLSREPADVQHRVKLVQSDMRKFDLGTQFALVTSPFRPFQHLTTVEDQLACLACIHRHLRKSGRLILDLFNPSIAILANREIGPEFGDEPEFVMPGGRKVVRRERVVARDYNRQVLDLELIYYVNHPNGLKERLVQAFQMRWLFRYEVEHLLVRSGFEIEAGYSDYEKTPFGTKYPGELIFVAKKPGN
ncbi:MAG: class I SAM-dependent methyltransferase [bacterium]